MTQPTVDVSVGAGHVAGIVFTVLIIGLCGGFMGGWTVHGWLDAKTQISAQSHAVAATAKESARRAKVAQEFVRGKQQREVFYEQDPDWWKRWLAAHPDLGHCDIGDDGLRDWNRWNQGPAANDAQGAAGDTAAAAAGEERQAAGSGGQPQADGAGVQRLPRAGDRAGKGGEH